MREEVIQDKDWKLFKKRSPEWLSRFYQQQNKKNLQLMISSLPEKDKFWQMEKHIQNAKKNPVLELKFTKSNMLTSISTFLNEGLITEADLEGFSDELTNYILIVERMNEVARG